jgi:hypothetical protein
MESSQITQDESLKQEAPTLLDQKDLDIKTYCLNPF